MLQRDPSFGPLTQVRLFDRMYEVVDEHTGPSESVGDFVSRVRKCGLEGVTNKHSATTKFLFNFNPEFGFVVDSRAHRAIRERHVSAPKGTPGKEKLLETCKAFYEQDHVIELRRVLSNYLAERVGDFELCPGETTIWAGRFVDKYLFFHDPELRIAATKPRPSRCCEHFLEAHLANLRTMLEGALSV